DPLDSALSVSWTMPSDVQGAASYKVHVRGPDGADKVTAVSGGALRSVEIGGLTNLVTYAVTVTSLDASGPSTTRRNESAGFTVRTGTYEPNVDEEAALGGSKPFESVFGTGKSRFLWRMELDFDLFDKFGRASLGFSAGFWQAVGKGRLQSNTSVAAKDTILF